MSARHADEIDWKIAEYRGSRPDWSDAAIYELIRQERGADDAVAQRFAMTIVSEFDTRTRKLARLDPFLASFEWRRVRMAVLVERGGRCECCGTTAADGATLNVDHVKNRKQFPELALTKSNLQVLCDVCNHGKGNRYNTDWRVESRP